MKIRLLLLTIVILVFSIQAQKIVRQPTYTHFGTGTVILTNAMADTSNYVDLSFGYSGNGRISVQFDTTSASGSTLAYLDLMYKVSDSFDGDSLKFKTVTLDSFQVADDGTVKTYQLSYNFNYFKDPILGYKMILRQSGTQVNRFKVEVLLYKP